MRLIVTLICAGFVLAAAEPRRLEAQAGQRTSTETQCAADLGAGIKTKRTFCDVLIAAAPAESVAMTLPRRTGAATLRFDLHNRFSIPTTSGPAILAYARHEAIVSVIQPTGDVIGQAAVVREFRTVADLFDQIGGGAHPGGVKAVAPGKPEPARLTIPADVTAIGIVGSRLVVTTRVGGRETFDTPGRPVALVSNVRLEYRPR
jgi:hypothetical protein